VLTEPAEESDTGRENFHLQKYNTHITQHNAKFLSGIEPVEKRELLAASLSAQSWRRHNTALVLFKDFTKGQVEQIDSEKLENFVTFCINEKKLKTETVKSYLGSLKLWHELRGFSTDIFEKKVLKKMLDGSKNLEMYQLAKKPSRKVFTLPLLRILGHEIAKKNWTEKRKQVLWTACVVAFFGSLRAGEILCKEKNFFRGDEDFLWSDVKFKDGFSVILRLKITKNKTQNGEFIDLFRNKELKPCPVKCLEKLFSLKDTEVSLHSPVFALSNSEFLTPAELNFTIQEILGKYIGKGSLEYSGHSLRAAIPSAIAEHPELTSEQDVKQWGRWSSTAYTRYTRLKYNQKLTLYNKIINVLKL
jgi:hypothetical protein